MYSYLRSQARSDDPLSMSSEGILLHPAINADVDESVTLQGHTLSFMTVDLAGPNDAIAARLCDAARLKFGDSKETENFQSPDARRLTHAKLQQKR
jgi:hypothetical protein